MLPGLGQELVMARGRSMVASTSTAGGKFRMAQSCRTGIDSRQALSGFNSIDMLVITSDSLPGVGCNVAGIEAGAAVDRSSSADVIIVAGGTVQAQGSHGTGIGAS
jgi:hypothetical protein